MAVRRAQASDYAAAEPASDPDFVDENTVASSRSSSPTRRGWGAATQVMQETSSSFAEDWPPPAGETLGKFLEDEPFTSVKQHWVNEIYLAKDGKASFYCLGDDCPLCAVGHKPRALTFFNFVPLSIAGKIEDEPSVVALKAGPQLTDLIKQEHEGRSGPLGRHFWALKKWETKTGKRSKINYALSDVRGNQLDEWGLDSEAVDKHLEGLDLYDEDIIVWSDHDELQTIVEKYLSKD